ncbi:MAG: hypothetical protein LBE13_05845 [Bacteroidales bacterium]|jgi:hypothetical protein|nr:hypothetical protein [Bacteroidales bacterium]
MYLRYFKIKGLSVNFPLLKKGSYEYQTAFRKNYGFLLIAYSLVFTGLYYGNKNLLYFFYSIAGMMYIPSLLKPEPLIYIAHFLSLKDLLRIKFVNTLYNNFILYVPLLVICSIVDITLFLRLLFLFGIVSMLAYASQLLKYAFDSEILSAIVFFCILLPVFIIILIDPICFIFLIFILLLLMLRINNRLRFLFYYAEN